jgi:hypothetical protein
MKFSTRTLWAFRAICLCFISLLSASCGNSTKTGEASGQKSDSLVIRERHDTVYVPSDTTNPQSALVPKIIITRDTVRIKK